MIMFFVSRLLAWLAPEKIKPIISAFYTASNMYKSLFHARSLALRQCYSHYIMDQRNREIAPLHEFYVTNIFSDKINICTVIYRQTNLFILCSAGFSCCGISINC